MSEKSEASEWLPVGVIAIDSGMCWIGDPCMVMHRGVDSLPPKEIGETWREFCRRCEELGIDGPSCAAQFKVGVCTRTGPGDGYYNVFVRKAPDGRMLEVKIVFEEE